MIAIGGRGTIECWPLDLEIKSTVHVQSEGERDRELQHECCNCDWAGPVISAPPLDLHDRSIYSNASRDLMR